MLKNFIEIILLIWVKIKVEKEIERRGDSIGKITFGITREETKNNPEFVTKLFGCNVYLDKSDWLLHNNENNNIEEEIQFLQNKLPQIKIIIKIMIRKKMKILFKKKKI